MTVPWQTAHKWRIERENLKWNQANWQHDTGTQSIDNMQRRIQIYLAEDRSHFQRMVLCQFFQHETKYVSYQYCHILFIRLWHISKCLGFVLYESPCILYVINVRHRMCCFSDLAALRLNLTHILQPSDIMLLLHRTISLVFPLRNTETKKRKLDAVFEITCQRASRSQAISGDVRSKAVRRSAACYGS